MAPALGPSHRFIVKGDIVNDLLKGIGNVVNPKRVFRELTDFKPGEFVLITVMLLAQSVSFFGCGSASLIVRKKTSMRKSMPACSHGGKAFSPSSQPS